jgi:hypothetical protein
MTIEHSRKVFEQNFRFALKESLDNKFLLSGVVGLGKTEFLRKISSFTSEPSVICFPTHNLKEEFLLSSKGKSSLFFGTPKPPPALASFIFFLGDEVVQDPLLSSSKIKRKFPEFYSSLESAFAFPETIVTTHDAFLCSSHKFINQKIVIFDEVPSALFGHVVSESFFSVHEMIYILEANPGIPLQKECIASLETLSNEMRKRNPFASSSEEDSFVIKKIANPLSKKEREFLFKFKDSEKLPRIFKGLSTILQSKTLFLNYLSNTLSSFSETSFSKEKKFICFSATPDIELFEKKGFIHLPSPSPDIKADIIHVPFNTSRVSLSSKDKQKEINKFIGEHSISKVISYKDLILRNQVHDVYFGNAEGTNKYEEEDSLAVVGTPMFNSAYFYDLAIKHNQLNFRKEDFLMVSKELTIEGKTIFFKTFQNPWLSKHHLFQIESSLIQVIGRLRPFLRKSKIYLLSKLPFMCNGSL